MLCKRCYTTRLSYLIFNKCVLIFIYNNILTSNQSIFLNSFKINVLINYIIKRDLLVNFDRKSNVAERPETISQDLRRKEPMHFFGMTSEYINGACGYYGLQYPE